MHKPDTFLATCWNFCRQFANYGLILTMVGAIGLAGGCGGDKEEDSDSVPNAADVDDSALGDSDSGQAMGLQTINFPYDSYVLTSDAKTKIKDNAQILKDKPSVRIQIEGHCDQRGSIQYNLALGEKRANAVLKQLKDMGVDKDRMTTISFGKERLLVTGTTEEDYAQNRRANFVVTAR